MEVQSITTTNFGAKNTFLQKSKQAATKLEKDYFKSLHYEAIARKSYLDFIKAENALDKFESGINSVKDVWAVIKIFARMANKKLDSVIYSADSYGACPNRFAEHDSQNIYPHRHYKLKSLYAK